ncbi:hypothetical protein DACRYDRAFT_113528 [Dacryopinax primogenitus]|uniref:Uncharacterized protein n=1 Tax=Dacryopinax primogenitus (strain DJM 731) TaxID=1858805 RepID=M5G561_DACPD|nr:uncharacterized protein DACRYDRAFT_113528 [Dacryopinax primogenitus]EJU05396.1 hypothetical protein DACRYDRAFT_113528 [Dacryopinax primogenitus]
MANSLDISMATLASFLALGILNGIFFVLFIGSLYVLFRRGDTQRANWILASAAIIMFVLTTTHLGFSFSRIQDIFIWSPANALNLNEWKELCRTTLTCVYMGIADTLLIWRCWIVWNRRLRVVALPIALLLTCIAMIALLLRAMYSSTQSAEGIFALSLAPWIIAVLVLTLVQNLLVTCLIVLRLWRMDSVVNKRTGSKPFQPVIAIVLESGILYSVTLFIWLLTYSTHSNSAYIMVDCINPMIGITYCLLVIRVRTVDPGISADETIPDEFKIPDLSQLASLEVHPSLQRNTAARSAGTTRTSAQNLEIPERDAHQEDPDMAV